MSFDKLLYVGCGHHVDIITHFPNTNNFVFVDIQPFSEYFGNKYYAIFYKPNFVRELIQKMFTFGFELQNITTLDENHYKKIFTIKQRLYYLFYQKPFHINPTLLLFYCPKFKKEVRYYISTDIDYTNLPRLYNDIVTCDTIVVSGHSPSIKYLQHMTKPVNFVGYSNTCYYYNSDDETENIIQYLHENANSISSFIKKFYAVNYDDGYIEQCIGFADFLNLVHEMRDKIML
jgi:hypothetical protein